MICRFGWSIGSGLFQFGLILLKARSWVACYRWRARAGKADHSPTATTMFL